MRIAFISTMDDSPWGGCEELWSQTLILLKQSNDQVYASVGYQPQLPSQVLDLMKQNIRVRMHPSRSARLPRRVWYKASQFDQRCHATLRSFRPDLVVISQGFNSGALSGPELAAKPGYRMSLSFIATANIGGSRVS